MAGKYGSASIFFLVDGFDVITMKMQELRYKIQAVFEASAGLGDPTKQRLPTGVSEVTFAQSGGFFDTQTNGAHTALKDGPSSPQATERIVTAGFAGQTVGEAFVGFSGSFSTEYEVLGEFGGLTKANASYQVNGAADHGVILHPLGPETVDVNGAAVDNLVSSADGGAAYLQVKSITGLTGAIFKVQHSTDGSVWADLVTFTNITAAPGKERIAVAGTVNRYTRYTADVTGAGSVTFFVGFSRG